MCLGKVGGDICPFGAQPFENCVVVFACQGLVSRHESFRELRDALLPSLLLLFLFQELGIGGFVDFADGAAVVVCDEAPEFKLLTGDPFESGVAFLNVQYPRRVYVRDDVYSRNDRRIAAPGKPDLYPGADAKLLCIRAGGVAFRETVARLPVQAEGEDCAYVPFCCQGPGCFFFALSYEKRVVFLQNYCIYEKLSYLCSVLMN